MVLSQKPKQIFDKDLQNVGKSQKKHFIPRFIPSAYVYRSQTSNRPRIEVAYFLKVC